ncbi:MAG: hypothetical protein MI784_15410 [Cytophagales bacterium]|nr:hypothetical protein [Cytophagales bacterium]
MKFFNYFILASALLAAACSSESSESVTPEIQPVAKKLRLVSLAEKSTEKAGNKDYYSYEYIFKYNTTGLLTEKVTKVISKDGKDDAEFTDKYIYNFVNKLEKINSYKGKEMTYVEEFIYSKKSSLEGYRKYYTNKQGKKVYSDSVEVTHKANGQVELKRQSNGYRRVSTIIFDQHGNLTRKDFIKTKVGDPQPEYTVTDEYTYDDKISPLRMIMGPPTANYIADSPEYTFLSYNNVTMAKSTDSEGVTTDNYKFTYNEYGYPIKREELGNDGEVHRVVTFTYEEVE